MSSSEILTIKEVSKLLKVPVDCLYNMTSKKQIPYFKVNRLLRFDKEKVLEHFMKAEDGQEVQ